MAKIITFSTGYNELHVTQKHLTKFLEIMEDSKFVEMSYDPCNDDYTKRVGVLKENDRCQLANAPIYMSQEDFDDMKEIADKVKADAEARAEESDA